MTGAQHPAVQRLQFFLPESRWDPDRVNTRRLELPRADPAAAPHGGGVFADPAMPAAPPARAGDGERGTARRPAGAVLAAGAARGARLAFPVDRAAALAAGSRAKRPAAAT